MDDRRGGIRRRTNALCRIGTRPERDPAPPPVSEPIPWIPSIVMMRVIDGGASAPDELLIRSSTRKVFRVPLQLVEPPVRRLAEVIAAIRGKDCSE
jgi:hypothetical protein